MDIMVRVQGAVDDDQMIELESAEKKGRYSPRGKMRRSSTKSLSSCREKVGAADGDSTTVVKCAGICWMSQREASREGGQ